MLLVSLVNYFAYEFIKNFINGNIFGLFVSDSF